MRLTCGSPQQARPPGDGEGRCLARPGQGRGRPQAVPTQGCGGLPPQPQHKVGRTNTNKRGLRAPGSRVPASPSRAGLAGRWPPEGGSGTLQGKGTKRTCPAPLPSPCTRDTTGSSNTGHGLGQGRGAAGWGAPGSSAPARRFAFASSKSRTQRHVPAAPGPWLRLESPGRSRTQPSPAASPARKDARRTRMRCARCRDSEADCCSRAPRFATSGEDRETGSSQKLGEQRERVWGPGPRPAGADHRRRLKVQQAAAYTLPRVP